LPNTLRSNLFISVAASFVLLHVGGLLTGCGAPSKKSAAASIAESPQNSGATAAPESLNYSMIQLRDELATLEPYIYSSLKFENEVSQKFILEKVQNLARLSRNLRHSPAVEEKDPTVRHLAGKFSERLERAEFHFSKGRKEFARDYLMSVKNFCVHCHIGASGGPNYTASAVKGEFFKDLRSFDRVEYYLSRREFNAASGELAKILKAKYTNQNQPPYLGRAAFLAMQISVQHLQNKKLAQQVVINIEGNSSLPLFLRNKAELWKKSLLNWKNESLGSAVEAMTLFDQRVSEVDTFRALPVILAGLTDSGGGSPQNATLFYVAAKAYQSLDEFAPRDIAEVYFEACIRERPHSDQARNCYMEYSDSVRGDLDGSFGKVTPPAVRAKLEELKKLAE